MLKLIIISFLAGIAVYVAITLVKIITEYITAKINKTDFQTTIDNSDLNNNRLHIANMLATGITFTILYSLVHFLDNSENLDNPVFIFLAIGFAISLLPTYYFAIVPSLYLFFNKDFVRNKEIEKLTDNQYDIRVIKKNITNAYATGILPFSKVIVIGEPLVNKMTDDELRSVIYHEIGHLKLNHIKILFVLNILLTIGWVAFNFFFLQKILPETTSYFKYIKVFFIGATFGLLIYYLPSFIMYKFEYYADLYSAKHTSKESMISALKKLDEISSGEMQKGNATHPSLEKRIQNIMKGND